MADIINLQGKLILDTWDEEGRIVLRHCRCPKCKLGEMRPTGRMAVSKPAGAAPPKFEHHCTKCDQVELLDMQFPATAFIPETEKTNG